MATLHRREFRIALKTVHSYDITIYPSSSRRCLKMIDLHSKNVQMQDGALVNPSELSTLTSEWLEQRLGGLQPSNGQGLQSVAGVKLGKDSASFVLHSPSSLAQHRILQVFGLSASSGQGLELLLESLQDQIASSTGTSPEGEGYMITRYFLLWTAANHWTDYLESLPILTKDYLSYHINSQ